MGIFTNWIKKLKAQWKLWRYIRKLPPEQQRWARDFSNRIKDADQQTVYAMFRKEVQNLSEKQHRVTEKLDRFKR